MTIADHFLAADIVKILVVFAELTEQFAELTEQGPLDAMRALFHHRLWPPDQNGLGQGPGETSTSPSTGKASIPNNENVCSFASMPASAHKKDEWNKAGVLGRP